MTEVTKRRTLLAEMSAEFAGTMILILFGVGVVAQVVAGKTGEYQSINWAWGLGVMLGIYVAGKISGAHLNPAVTIALAVFRGFSWSKVAPYALAQTLGAFTAALIVRWNYSEAIAAIDPGHTIKSQGIFSTLPANGAEGGVHTAGALRDQIIGTAILMLLILAITDIRNSTPGSNMTALIVGLAIVAIGMAWGSNAGYAINPARDFGPRLASFLTGYGGSMRDQYGVLYFWVPIVGPIVGALIGAALYDGLIGRHLPVSEEDAEPGRTPETPEIADEHTDGATGGAQHDDDYPSGRTRGAHARDEHTHD